ncbi:MAG: hypothetical protein ACKVJU_15650 [Verrucomicrobiales bacterium]
MKSLRYSLLALFLMALSSCQNRVDSFRDEIQDFSGSLPGTSDLYFDDVQILIKDFLPKDKKVVIHRGNKLPQGIPAWVSSAKPTVLEINSLNVNLFYLNSNGSSVTVAIVPKMNEKKFLNDISKEKLNFVRSSDRFWVMIID